MKKTVLMIVTTVLVVFLLSGCGSFKAITQTKNNKKTTESLVTTIDQLTSLPGPLCNDGRPIE